VPHSLDQENRVAIPTSALDSISDLTRRQSEQVQTQLVELADSSYSPTALEYHRYGDLSVFRCGDKIRLFGAVIEAVPGDAPFDNVVVLLTVTEHDYDSVGLSKQQASELRDQFCDVSSEETFRQRLDAPLLSAEEIRELL
jgi:hypothetical protein